MGITGSHFVSVNADVAPETKRYYQQLTRFSAALAFLADVSMGTLGGELKRKEKLSARLGDNVTSRSQKTRWYTGPAFLEYLETVDTGGASAPVGPFRFPVQWVNRPDATFRGYAGTVAGGVVRSGEEIVVARSGLTARVARIAPRMRDLGVDHLLVDPPGFSPGRFRDEVARLRDLV